MRINKFVASASGLSRRQADAAISEGRVLVNDVVPEVGQDVTPDASVTLDGRAITPAVKSLVLFNKPDGYVCSRDGQGSLTIYNLLPAEYQHLNPIGRLDKNTSGLLVLTNDGDLAQQLTHPSRQKQKIYEVTLDKALEPLHRQMIQDHGVQLEDGPSKFELTRIHDGNDLTWQITMHEGRNRQIRRTFQALGYEVKSLNRTQFGDYTLGDLPVGKLQQANRSDK
jgi:23S rRNA pseudouridine2605 synthase